MCELDLKQEMTLKITLTQALNDFKEDFDEFTKDFPNLLNFYAMSQGCDSFKCEVVENQINIQVKTG